MDVGVTPDIEVQNKVLGADTIDFDVVDSVMGVVYVQHRH